VRFSDIGVYLQVGIGLSVVGQPKRVVAGGVGIAKPAQVAGTVTQLGGLIGHPGLDRQGRGIEQTRTHPLLLNRRL
jgi:hypothetical protein